MRGLSGLCALYGSDLGVSNLCIRGGSRGGRTFFRVVSMTVPAWRNSGIDGCSGDQILMNFISVLCNPDG